MDGLGHPLCLGDNCKTSGYWVVLGSVVSELFYVVYKKKISTDIRKNHCHRRSKWTVVFTKLMCPDLLACVDDFF